MGQQLTVWAQPALPWPEVEETTKQPKCVQWGEQSKLKHINEDVKTGMVNYGVFFH